MTDTNLLETKIKEAGLKKSYIAKMLNLSRQGFKNKCENKSSFNSTHIVIMCDLLNIKDLTEKEKIFFAK